MNRIILYPFFEECSRYILDSFWLDIFKDCAVGKIPKGVTYDDGENILRFDNGEIVKIPLSYDDGVLAIKNAFKTYLGIDTQKLYVPDRSDDNKKSWKQLRSKIAKDKLILDYSLSLKNKFQLTDRQSKDLTHILSMAIQFKNIKSEDIICKNGEIIKIKGLLFNPKTKTFKINSKQHTKHTPQQAKQDKFLVLVDKYLTKYCKSLDIFY